MKKVFILALLLMAGCTQAENANSTITPSPSVEMNSPSPTPTVAMLDLPEEEKTFSISGPTVMEKMSIATLEEFLYQNPQYEGSYRGLGSSSGVSEANEGKVNIGAASRELTDKEKEYGLSQILVGYNVVNVVVHPYVTVNNLTYEQLKGIYTGEITNWSELGGSNEPIVVLHKEDGSAARGLFFSVMGLDDGMVSSMDCKIAEGSGGVIGEVAWIPYSIGYTSREYTEGSIKTMTIDGYFPDAENIISKNYPIAAPCYYVYHEENLNAAAKDYLEFIVGEEGQNIINNAGVTPAGQ